MGRSGVCAVLATGAGTNAQMQMSTIRHFHRHHYHHHPGHHHRRHRRHRRQHHHHHHFHCKSAIVRHSSKVAKSRVEKITYMYKDAHFQMQIPT